MRVLLTNDDGIGATGLQSLRRALRELEGVELHVVAPDSNRSATARSITTRSPLWVEEVSFDDGDTGFATEGTPVDCVRFADLGLVGERPELIVSGINHGSNLGDDVTYSGTVAAALEGTLLHVPSIALSSERDDKGGADYELAAELAVVLGAKALAVGLPTGVFLSVNVPRPPARGIRITRQGTRSYRAAVIERLDPSGRPYFWIAGADTTPSGEPDGDHEALRAGYVSVTPLHANMTHDPSRSWLGDTVGEFAINNT